MIFVDSNIWCYYFDSSLKEHSAVSSKLNRIFKEESVAVNTLVMMEVSHYLIKHLGAVVGKEKADKMLQYPFVIVDFTYDMLMNSIGMLSRHSHTGIGGRDAIVLAAMEKLGCRKLITHDAAFKKIDEIDVIDPIM